MIAGAMPDATAAASGINAIQGVSAIDLSLCQSLQALARGDLRSIVEQPNIDFDWSQERGDDDENAVQLMWAALNRGVRQLANELTSRDAPREAETIFRSIRDLAVQGKDDQSTSLLLTFPGPHHLASLLLAASPVLRDRRLSSIATPSGPVVGDEWRKMVDSVSRQRPLLWPNHLRAIKEGFLDIGTSAAINFPTGAGKSTVIQLKAAATLSAGRSVVFFVPTHALLDQITKDLRAVFEHSLFESADGNATPRITVMTPELCLAYLGSASSAFSRTGLVVFDECHLLHPKDGLRDRRALDAMLSLLGICAEAPNADVVLLSAMMRNCREMADWLGSLTNRPSLALDNDWKPTRQARACLMYPLSELLRLQRLADERQATASARSEGPVSPGLKDKNGLTSIPWALFSLHQTWQSTDGNDYNLLQLGDAPSHLTLSDRWQIGANRNVVSASLAAQFVRSGLRTMVLVQNTTHVGSLARDLAATLGAKFEQPLNEAEIRLRELAAEELGSDELVASGPEHGVVRHHGLLLPFERRLSESLFARGAASAIVVSPTMAQGVNLPADAVVIAGDDRYDADRKRTEFLEPHELLNAAGRAGRAGNFSYGVVLVVPGQPVSFEQNKVGQRWFELKDRVFANSDQCLDISDPLELWLDVLQTANAGIDPDSVGFLSRLPVDVGTGVGATRALLSRSLAAYRARKANKEATYQALVDNVVSLRASLLADAPTWRDSIAAANGVPSPCIEILADLVRSSRAQTVLDWVSWWFAALRDSTELRTQLIPEPVEDAATSRGEPVGRSERTISRLEQACLEWMKGATLLQLDHILDPNLRTRTNIKAAREFVVRSLHHLSFGVGLVSRIWEGGTREDSWPSPSVALRAAGVCLREGFESPEMLAASRVSRLRMSRIQTHRTVARGAVDQAEIHQWVSRRFSTEATWLDTPASP